MHSLKYISVALLIIALPSVSGAQSSPIKITLEEAVDLALKNNNAIEEAANNVQRADYNVRGAVGNFLPNIDSNLGANQRVGRNFNLTTGNIDETTVNSINGGLNTSVLLFDGFQNIQNLRRAQHQKLSSEESLNRAKEDIIFQTTTSFLQIILDKELLRISKENLEAQKKQLERVNAQVQVGARPIVDKFNQESIVANNELDVIQRENSLNIRNIQLVRILQVDPLADYDFVAPEIDAGMTVLPKDYNLKELIQMAMDSRSDLKAQEYNIKSAYNTLRGSYGSLQPRISFNAGINTNYNDQFRERDPNNLAVFRKLPFNDQFFNRNINRFYGFSLSLPLFARFQNVNNIAVSRIDYKNAQLRLETQRLQVYQEVRQAYNDYQTAVKEVEATKKAFTAAEKAYETEQERYRIGSSTLIELSNANSEYVNAQSRRAQAMFRFVFQEQLLNYYLGIVSMDSSAEALKIVK